MSAVIECVPNFSEGTDARKVASILSAMRLDGVALLDWSEWRRRDWIFRYYDGDAPASPASTKALTSGDGA